MKNKLIDTARITVIAGKGGDGRVSFRRAKFIPKGGPDGGDGGKGGNVYIEGTENMATLLDFRSKVEYEAVSGEQGGANKMTGASAPDLVIKVPLGTLIYEVREAGNVLIGDITDRGQRVLVARGGIGGKGNDRFKSSTNRTPTQFTRGKEGEKKDLLLEIKLIADVGLIGLPNAGKSTLINQLTTANAKVANYPFTTLMPNLGVCKLSDGQKIIIADIPGLIEGASLGKGLGDDFLRHVERTRILVHVIDPYSEDGINLANILSNYEVIRKELRDFGADLQDKKEIVVINKLDVTEVKNEIDNILKSFKKRNIDAYALSAVTGEGIREFLNVLTKVVNETPKESMFEETQPVKLFTLDNLPNKRMVFRDDVVESK